MNQAHRSDQKNPEKPRALVVTEHAAQRYAECCWRGLPGGASLEARSAGEIMEAAIEADFCAARLVPRRERDALYVQQPRAIVKYGRAGAKPRDQHQIPVPGTMKVGVREIPLSYWSAG